MTTDPHFSRLQQPPSAGPPSPRRPGLLARVVGAIAGIALIAAVVVFSAVAFVVLLLAVATVGGWLWWQTRAVRRQLREQAAARPMEARAPPSANRQEDVTDAEVIREVRTREPNPSRN